MKKNTIKFWYIIKYSYLCSVNKNKQQSILINRPRKGGIKVNRMKYIIIYGLLNEKERYFKERNREFVSKSTYYRRKKVWKNPPIGVTIQEKKVFGYKHLFVGFDD